MSEDLQNHSAQYDEDGNIILPDSNDSQSRVARNVEWISTDSPKEIIDIKKTVKQSTQAFVDEGVKQYSWGAQTSLQHMNSLSTALRQIPVRFWKFLIQPVWIVVPNKKPKKYSRSTLFLLDTVRFGGTFAAIFLLLFAGMNYRSFWEIAKQEANPLQKIEHLQQEQTAMDEALRSKLLKAPRLSTAGNVSGDLLAFLPTVGPPDNRLIIPKLNVNIPIVIPSLQSLLQENWEQVEVDIQEALEDGVVHYPGTARPGQAGNFFVTGHSSYYPWAPGDYKTIFARLHYLDPGDEYYVYYGGDQHRYVITDKKEVKPSDVSVLSQPTDQRTATLMTCSPVGTTLRRLILSAVEVDPITGEVLAVGQKQETIEEELPQATMLPI